MTISSADILTFVKTKDEANEFQKQVDHLLGLLFSSTPFEKVISEQMPYDKQVKLLSFLTKQQINLANPAEVQKCLQEIKRIIAQIPILTLTLAFPPKEQVIEIIQTWFLVHIKQPVLLDIIVDATLIGGAIITYKGIFKDYSLKKILEEKYQQGDLSLNI